MHNRTFEILAKWLAKKTQAKIEFTNGGNAEADMTKNIISIPNNYKEGDEYAALARQIGYDIAVEKVFDEVPDSNGRYVPSTFVWCLVPR